jgi:hypothetical protein|tara:strand:+ start:1364 stop:1711 length:348 start_codon:yes stop_codon:yes gene_type:complete
MPNVKPNTTMQMGLGEAMKRLIMLHTKVTGRFATPEERDERDLILNALNEIKLDLGFDCNMDGVPDTVAIFAQSAETACCRLVPADTSRRTPAKKAAPKKKPATRRKTTATRRKK